MLVHRGDHTAAPAVSLNFLAVQSVACVVVSLGSGLSKGLIAQPEALAIYASFFVNTLVVNILMSL